MILDSESWMNIRRFRALRAAGATYAEIARECEVDWRTAPAPPLPAWVDTGTAVVDKSNLAAFREGLAAHSKPM